MKKADESKSTSPTTIRPILPRRKFDPAFKRDAVALWLSSGKSAREIGSELGISERHLHSWHKKHAPPTPTQGSQMESQLVALRRENALLRQQRDILKKTLGILSEPPNSATNGSTP
jgi:transposase-like protein